MPLHERSVIANARFIYAGKDGGLAGRLRYFQYRRMREHGRPENRKRLWVDRGLGRRWKAIRHGLEETATDDMQRNVVARTLVISPEIEFMQAIPAARRERVLAELTENTVERWFESMDLPTAEYSFIIHHGESKSELPDGRAKSVAGGREFLHSHVMLAATVPAWEQERERYYVGKKQIPLLHEAAREELERIWTREIGRERLGELNRELGQRTERYRALQRQHEYEQLLKGADYEAPDPEATGERLPPIPSPEHRHDLDAWFPRPPDRDPDIDFDP